MISNGVSLDILRKTKTGEIPISCPRTSSLHSMSSETSSKILSWLVVEQTKYTPQTQDTIRRTIRTALGTLLTSCSRLFRIAICLICLLLLLGSHSQES